MRLMLVSLVALLAAGCGNDDAGEPSAASPTETFSTQEPTDAGPEELPEPEAVEDDVPPDLASEGVGTELMLRADRLASIHGYLYGGEDPGEGARLALTTCQRALDGWEQEDAVADDISVGAPPDAARAWNDFVYAEFCPRLG